MATLSKPAIYDQVMCKPKYNIWNPTQPQPALDEMLIYRWEGYGQPYSNSGSLSSLSSFGHVDDLVLSKELLALASLSNSSLGDSSITSSQDSDEVYEASSTSGFQFKDSWV